MTDTETLTRAVLTTDGKVLVEQPDGSYRPATGETDWARIDRQSEAEVSPESTPSCAVTTSTRASACDHDP